MKKTNESGRSMVEMLGVLAIVGVLSVGGLAGYTTAMNKYRATEIMNAISLTLVAAESEGTTKSYSDAYTALPNSISNIIKGITVKPSTHAIIIEEENGGVGCTTDKEPCKTVAANLQAGGSFKGYKITVGESGTGTKLLYNGTDDSNSNTPSTPSDAGGTSSGG